VHVRSQQLITFVTNPTLAASDKCQHEKRKTINGDDLLWAMSTLGFYKYVDPLKAYLAKYREVRQRQSSVRFFSFPLSHPHALGVIGWEANW